MTEPRVEAGDRALETARKIHDGCLACDYENRIPPECEEEIKHTAALIQSAMNAQERELREALRILITHSRQFKNGWIGAGVFEERLAEAERLLAERGDTK